MCPFPPSSAFLCPATILPALITCWDPCTPFCFPLTRRLAYDLLYRTANALIGHQSEDPCVYTPGLSADAPAHHKRNHMPVRACLVALQSRWTGARADMTLDGASTSIMPRINVHGGGMGWYRNHTTLFDHVVDEDGVALALKPGVYTTARQHFAEHYFRSNAPHLHSYGPGPHSC